MVRTLESGTPNPMHEKKSFSFTARFRLLALDDELAMASFHPSSDITVRGLAVFLVCTYVSIVNIYIHLFLKIAIVLYKDIHMLRYCTLVYQCIPAYTARIPVYTVHIPFIYICKYQSHCNDVALVLIRS